MKKMKAIVVSSFGGPEVLKCVPNLELPKVLDNQVCVKVSYAGVNPVDTYKRSGNHMLMPTLPYTPGTDGAGLVHLCGSKVTKFKPGDRVYFCGLFSGGSYAEYCAVSEEHVFHLHDRLSFKEGASIGVPYFTAYRALVVKANAQKGQTVLVHGASGGVGIACCQLAKHIGLKVIGTAGTKEGMNLVLQNGATLAFNHHDKDYIDKIKKSSEKIDIIVEMLANVNLQKDLDTISENGVIVVVGSRDKVEIVPRSLFRTESTITAVHLYKFTPDAWKKMGELFDAGQKEGWVKPIVGQVFKLEEAPLAHEEVIKHQQGTKGKILIAFE